MVAQVGWSSEAILIVISGTGLTFGMWWVYFILPSAPVLARHRERKWAWGYGHIVLFGAVAAVGAGLHVAAYAAEGETTIGTVGVVLSVAIPVFIFSLAYFVLWSILFRAVDAFHVMLAAGMAVFLRRGRRARRGRGAPGVVSVRRDAVAVRRGGRLRDGGVPPRRGRRAARRLTVAQGVAEKW